MTQIGLSGLCPRCGGRHRADADCAIPSRIGEIIAEKYRIVRHVGQGGMGTVYEAQHTMVGRRFAVKFLHPELARQEELLARFRREAQAAGLLENENITSVVDFGHAQDGVPFIVMEFLLGEDLARFLAREGPLPVARAAGIVIQACRGLDAAHAAGIVHRDLKPENLFLSKRGDGADLVKILDFGIAKLTGGADPVGSVTRTGSTLGTPFYMPPEQARGEKDLDHRADVYALGVILFEALSGQKPHPGDSYNAILYHILTQPPADLGALRPELPIPLRQIVRRALSSEPRDRQGSAMELARDLAPFVGRQITPLRSQFELRVGVGGPRFGAATPAALSATTPSPIAGGHRPTGAPARFSLDDPPALPADSEDMSLFLRAERARRRNRGLTIGGLAAAAVAAALWFVGREQPPPPARNTAATDVAAVPIPAAAAPAPVPPPAPTEVAPPAPTPAPAAAPDSSPSHPSTHAAAETVPGDGKKKAPTERRGSSAAASERPRGQKGGRPRGQVGPGQGDALATPTLVPAAVEPAADPALRDAQVQPGRRRRPVFERANPYQ